MNLFVYATEYKARSAFLLKLMELEDEGVNFKAYHNNKVLITDKGDSYRFVSSKGENLRGQNPKTVFIDDGVEIEDAYLTKMYKEKRI